jgi:hypothetical protein
MARVYSLSKYREQKKLTAAPQRRFFFNKHIRLAVELNSLQNYESGCNSYIWCHIVVSPNGMARSLGLRIT